MDRVRSRVDLWESRALALVALGRVGLHAHAAGAALFALRGEFRIRCPGEDWRRCQAAFVPSRVQHELDCGDTHMLVVYLAPGLGDAQGLCEGWGLDARQITTDPRLGLGPLCELGTALASDGIDPGDLQLAVDLLVGRRAPSSLAEPGFDPRVDGLARSLLAHPSDSRVLAQEAARFGISTSRLRHLFAQETGVSFRELRRWQRMRVVGRHLAEGADLTQAAHEAGFSDSAQLSRDFRAAFGIPPSRAFARHATVMNHGAPA